MKNYTPKEPERDQDAAASAGEYTPESQESRDVKPIADIITEAVDNFTTLPIIVVEGLEFKHYELLTTIHYYLNSRFESGDLDENGDQRYFHNIITPRNAHATKNIDLDTKDMLITSDSEEGWWFSFLLRNELQAWMRKPHVQFGKLLNDLATNLPNFGMVIWKRCGVGKDIYIKEVDLRDAIFDPGCESIRESGIFIERSVIKPWDAMDKAKEGYWDRSEVIAAIRSAQVKKDEFLKNGSPQTSAEQQYSVTDTTPSLDAWEVHGWFPRASLDACEMLMDPDVEAYAMPERDETEEGDVDYVYARVVLLGLEDSMGHVVDCMELEPEDFPYHDFKYFRRVPGRCLPIGNAEALIPLQVRMNELINRFFSALRIGSLHLYQTRKGSAFKNLTQDAQDGDILETGSEITPIATELRAFNQYQVELNNIEAQADRICNTTEVVTGDSMPTNTPFRLGAQLGASAQKIYEQVREDVGLGLTFIFENWILPEIMEDMTLEHVIELTGSAEELATFDRQYRKWLISQSVKDYVISQERLPTEDEMQVVQEQLAEQLEGKTRKAQITKGYFTMERIRSLRIHFDVTDERKNFAAEKETLSSLLTIIASNPMVLQSEEARTLIARIMEASGISPLMLASFASKPKDPNAQVDPAAPAAENFSQNPGDAAPAPATAGAPAVAQPA